MSVRSRDYAAVNGAAPNDQTAAGYTIDDSTASNGVPNGNSALLVAPGANGDTATVHAFNPDASPAEKKAQALKAVGAKLDSVDMSGVKKEDKGGAGLQSDIGGKTVKPSMSMTDVAAASQAEGQKGDGSGQEVVPGAIPASKAQAIPDWYKIGWSGQFPDRGQVTDPEEIRNRDILETFVGEMYYGSWYHNAAIIFFAVAASHYATLFGGGWASLLIILAACATYYQTSTRRIRRNIRDDVARESARKRLFTDHETVGWLNEFMHRFWLIYEPVLSATIVASVDATLEASTPGFLDSLRLSTFTLGTKAPAIDFIRTHPETADDEVVMDWMINFTPADVSDLKVRVAEAKVNPKIVLAVRFGKGVIGATKDIVVEDIMFKGEMRIRMKLMNNFPHIQIVDLSFLSKPDFDFILRPVGFDINMIPGLTGFIHAQVHATLGPMMYDPNVFTLNMEQMLAGAPIDTAVGVLQITLYNAHGLKGSKIGGGSPDPYVAFSVGARAELDRTKVKHSTTSPHWNSTHFLLVNNLSDVLSMTVMDFNSTRKDSQLGIANFDLQSLVADAEQEGIAAPIMQEGKEKGEVKFDVTFYPCLTPKKLENGEEEPIPDTSTGVVRLTLHQAKDLDSKKSSVNSLAAYGKVYVNGKDIHRTALVKRTANPVFESFTEILVSDKASAVIGIGIRDEKTGEDQRLGYSNIKLTDILEANAQQQDWFPLSDARTGKIRLSATWKPVLMSGAINGAGAYRPPIGVLRFWFKKATDLKNVEALTGGKSDPYVRVMRSGVVLQRSQIFNNNLDPEFDEIVYVPIHDIKDKFRLELMDYQHMGKDRSLGSTELDVNALVTVGADQHLAPYESTGTHKYEQYLKSAGKGVVKGKLDFEVGFHPCTHLKFDPFKAPTSSLDKAKAQDDSDGASTVDVPVEGTVPSEAGQALTTGNQAIAEGEEAATPENGDAATPDEEKKDKGVVLTREQLLASQSGVLVFNIMSGDIAKKNARLEFLFDDGYWPAYSTEASRSTNAKWDETGEAFIRELDWSQVILKLNTAEKETKEEVYAQFTTSLKSFLDDCLDKPHEFVLQDLIGGGRSTVSIQCKYIPVPITLEARESVNNMGIMTVMVDNAKGLKSADRNGYSDPYAQFLLNGMKVFKTEVKKKTLDPTWGEKFDIEVPSRVHADFRVDVYDWDRVGISDKLGRAQISLAELEPMTQTPMQVHLLDPSSGDKQGVVNLRVTFRPGFIIRSRQATSTFSSVGRVATGLGGVGAGVGHVGVGAVKGVGNVGVGAVKGVGKGVGGVGKLGFAGVRKVTNAGHKRGPSASVDDSIMEDIEGSPLDGTIASSSGLPANSTTPSTPRGIEGKLSITVAGASGLGENDLKPYVVVKHNGKTVGESKSIRHTNAPVWDETFTFDASEGNCQLDFTVFDKKTLGKDKELGGCSLDGWQHLQPMIGKTEADVHLPLGPEESGGNIHIRLNLQSSNGAASFLDSDPTAALPSSPSARSHKSSKSRFSLHRERTPVS